MLHDICSAAVWVVRALVEKVLRSWLFFKGVNCKGVDSFEKKDSTPWNPAYFAKGVYTYDSDSRIRQNPMQNKT